MEITRKGRHKLIDPDGNLISEHTEVKEVYEAVANLPDGEYTLVTADERITVKGKTPTAKLTFVSLVDFKAILSTHGTAAKGNATLASWSLSWGDSSPAVIGSGSPPAQVSHVYTPGTYTPELIVTDSKGSMGRYALTSSIIVNPATPIPPVEPPVDPPEEPGRVMSPYGSTINAGDTTTELFDNLLRKWQLGASTGDPLNMPILVEGVHFGGGYANLLLWHDDNRIYAQAFLGAALTEAWYYWDDAAGFFIQVAGDPRVIEEPEPEVPNVLVGAIRFDAWSSNNGTDPYIHWNNLQTYVPFRYRAPYYAVIDSPTTLAIDENQQTVIDQDILYASDAGIDFWIINHYGARSQYAYLLQKTSPYRDRIKYCFIESASNQTREDQLLVEIADAQYLRVLGGRPVVFFFMGTNNYSDNGSPATAAALRQRIINEIGANPYFVALNFTAGAAAADASTFGFDAISTYGGGIAPLLGAGTNVPYASQVAAEEGEWHQFASTGFNYLPTVTTGWTTFDEVTGLPNGNFETQEATPAEIANHLSNALAFHETHQATNPANLIVLSAWNEFTEGHYLAPYNPATNAIGTGRIDAIEAVLNPAVPDPTPPSVTSINRSSGSPTTNSTLRWNVTFNQAVQGVTLNKFSLASTLSGSALTSISGSGANYVVTATTGTITQAGTVGLNLSSTSGITSVASGLALTATFTGQVYSVQVPIIVDPPESPAGIVGFTDLVYKGAFRIPGSLSDGAGVRSNFPWPDGGFGMGLTVRYISGVRHFMSVGYGTGHAYGGQPYLIQPPALGSLNPSVEQSSSIIRRYGNIYSSKRINGDNGQPLETNNSGPTSVYWDEQDQLFYFTYKASAYSINADFPSFGYAVLNEGSGGVGSGTCPGTFKLAGLEAKTRNSGIIPIPQSFANAYTGGRRIGIGCGGYNSNLAGGDTSMGAALFAIDPPIGQTHLAALPNTPLVGYHPAPSDGQPHPGMGRMDRPAVTRPLNWGDWSLQKFNWTDACINNGVWLTNSAKGGVIFPVQFSTGSGTYSQGFFSVTGWQTWWVVYDPADLAAVAQGTKPRYDIQPVAAWQMTYPNVLCDFVPDGREVNPNAITGTSGSVGVYGSGRIAIDLPNHGFTAEQWFAVENADQGEYNQAFVVSGPETTPNRLVGYNGQYWLIFPSQHPTGNTIVRDVPSVNVGGFYGNGCGFHGMCYDPVDRTIWISFDAQDQGGPIVHCYQLTS